MLLDRDLIIALNSSVILDATIEEGRLHCSSGKKEYAMYPVYFEP